MICYNSSGYMNSMFINLSGFSSPGKPCYYTGTSTLCLGTKSEEDEDKDDLCLPP